MRRRPRLDGCSNVTIAPRHHAFALTTAATSDFRYHNGRRTAQVGKHKFKLNVTVQSNVQVRMQMHKGMRSGDLRLVPPVGFEPTLRTLLGGRPLPLGYGGIS